MLLAISRVILDKVSANNVPSDRSMLRYKLRTLLIVVAIGPAFIGWLKWAMEPSPPTPTMVIGAENLPRIVFVHSYRSQHPQRPLGRGQ